MHIHAHSQIDRSMCIQADRGDGERSLIPHETTLFDATADVESGLKILLKLRRLFQRKQKGCLERPLNPKAGAIKEPIIARLTYFTGGGHVQQFLLILACPTAQGVAEHHNEAHIQHAMPS